jgi:hypothetical protein
MEPQRNAENGPPVSYGENTDKALSLIHKRVGVDSGDVTMSPSEVEERVEKYFYRQAGILIIPRGNSERDGVNIGVRDAVIKDTIDQSTKSPTFKESLTYLNKLSVLTPAKTPVELKYDPFTGEIADFKGRGAKGDRDAMWTVGVSGRQITVEFGEGGQISKLSFEHQELQKNGPTRDQIMVLAKIANHNKSHWKEGLDLYQPGTITGTQAFWATFAETVS